MAAMTTVLTPFSNNGNSRTTSLSDHTALKPRIVIEKRKVAEGNQTMCEVSANVIYATEDADGVVLQQKIAIGYSVRYPVLGKSTDIDAAVAVFRDIVAGDEFANAVSTQEWLS